MSETNPMTEKLITEFTDNYMEKLFYFYLKKTGSSNEVEDLTQDIALNILAALNNGTIPTSFFKLHHSTADCACKHFWRVHRKEEAGVHI